MAYIEDVEKSGGDLLYKLGQDWLESRLNPDITFRASSKDGGDNLETTLNYMFWRGWIEIPVITNEGDGTVALVRLTPQGKDLAISGIHGKKPPATLEPSRGRRCPY